MKIRNINGTSDNKCGCGAWLKHWEKFSGQSVAYCPVENCLGTEIVGAHVQRDDASDQRWYIYPLCSAHNKSTTPLTVSDAYRLVSANKKETCEK